MSVRAGFSGSLMMVAIVAGIGYAYMKRKGKM